jgi:uncharacterized membrane protein
MAYLSDSTATTLTESMAMYYTQPPAPLRAAQASTPVTIRVILALVLGCACVYIQHTLNDVAGRNGDIALLATSSADDWMAITIALIVAVTAGSFVGFSIVDLARRNFHPTVHCTLVVSIAVLAWVIVMAVQTRDLINLTG